MCVVSVLCCSFKCVAFQQCWSFTPHEVKESSASFVDVLLNFESDALHVWHIPLVVITLELLYIGLQEFPRKNKKLFFQELVHLWGRESVRLVCVSSFDSSRVQNSSWSQHIFLFLHLSFLFLFPYICSSFW